MAMKFTQIPAGTFETLQLNAGVVVDEFTPDTRTYGNILGATSGGVSFTDTPSFLDMGDGIDNCPTNMMELKKIASRDIKISGTFVSVTPALAKKLAYAADLATATGKITPRDNLKLTDFDDFWWVGDYSDVNEGASAGYIAIHIMNALNTGGLRFQSADKDNGQFPFEFTAHYSINAQDTVPYEFYIKAGTASA